MRYVLAGFAVIAASMTAYAHHGWSSYDEKKLTKITGAVSSVKWESPHGQVIMTHQGAQWVVVLAPTSRMEARGLKRDMLQDGKSVTVEAYPKRDGQKEMRAERMIVDGKTIELR